MSLFNRHQHSTETNSKKMKTKQVRAYSLCFTV
jgi:hypothetical protein